MNDGNIRRRRSSKRTQGSAEGVPVQQQQQSLPPADSVSPGQELTVLEAPQPPQETAHVLRTPQEDFSNFDEIIEVVSANFVDTARNMPGGAEELKQEESYYKFVSRVMHQHPELNVKPIDIPTLVTHLRTYQFGYREIEDLLTIDGLENLYFNSFDQGFYTAHGKKFKIEEKIFTSETDLMNFLHKVANDNGLSINSQQANMDATLADGSRVNATLSPPAWGGPDLVIRKHREIPFTLDEYVAKGVITAELYQDLEKWVRAGFNMIVSGGTGTGKTTFLNTIGNNIIPKSDRILILETNKELQIHTDDTKYFVTQEDATRENASSEISITMKDLVRYSLRKFPMRIIVGEVRGKEAYSMLIAWNSGHDGSLCTIHANNPLGAIMKLEQLAMSAAEASTDEVRMLIPLAVDLVVQVRDMPNAGGKRVHSVAQVLHPYKYDPFNGDTHRRVSELSRENGLVEMYDGGLSLLYLYRLDNENRLVKVNDAIEIDGKEFRQF